MAKPDFQPMDQGRFDDLLERGLSSLPPPNDEIVHNVSPWRLAMQRILWGLGLCVVTIRFWDLDYILPGIGLFLLLLGFRAFRRENGWFRLGYWLSVFREGYFLADVLLGFTIWKDTLLSPSLSQTLVRWFAAAQMLQLVCLWRGLRAVQDKAGQPRSGAGGALVAWHLVVLALALVSYSGLLLIILLLTAYCFLLRNLWKLTTALDQAGYAISPAPARLSDRGLTLLLGAILAAGLLVGYTCFQTYPMDWSPAEQTESAELDAIRAHLLDLGMPKAVLADLTDEDIAACAGADQIVVDEVDLPINDGRSEFTSKLHFKNGVYYIGNARETVYDVKELHLTGVAVRIVDEWEQWKIIHHFSWTVDPGFMGTECLHIWPVDRRYGHWSSTGELSGQVLYDRDGTVWAAPYDTLTDQTWEQIGPDTVQSSNDIYAAFSFPKGGARYRGYVSYEVIALNEGCILDSWANYIHQQRCFHFPAESAMDAAMNRTFFSWNGAFRAVEECLQFHPSDLK